MSGIGQMAMNPMGTAQSLGSTMADPQKMLAGFVGPTAAGIKGEPPKPGALQKPQGSAMTPDNFGNLQQKYTVGAGAGDSGMDPQTMAFLQKLAAGA